MSNGYNFNTSQPPQNWGAPLVNFAPLAGQQSRQPSAPAAPAGGMSPTAAQNLGASIGKWLQSYQQQAQRYGIPSQPQQQLAPQQSVAPPDNSGSPFNVTGALY